MQSRQLPRPAVKSGDIDGLDKVYSEWGGLICGPDEQIIREVSGWEMEVRSPWRRVLPGLIFSGFGGSTSSSLYITNDRIVLIRKIDAWRELKGELSPLGLPKALEKESKLRKLQSSGGRQFCAIWPGRLRLSRMKKFTQPRSLIDLFVTSEDGKQYAVTYWKPQGTDEETLSLIESRFVQ